MKQSFRQLNTFFAAITFNLALVGIHLQAPESAIIQERVESGIKGWKRLAMQSLWFAMEAQAQMPLRISVPEKEPEVYRARSQSFFGYLCDQINLRIYGDAGVCGDFDKWVNFGREETDHG